MSPHFSSFFLPILQHTSPVHPHIYPKSYNYIQNWGLIKSFDRIPILFCISSLLCKYNYYFCYHTCLYTGIETLDIGSYKIHILTKFNDDINYVDLPLWLPVALSLLEYWESAHSYLALAFHVSLAQLAIPESFPVFSVLFL